MEMSIRQVFTTPDGKQFDNKADAQNYLRGPKIREALNLVTKKNAELSTWLFDNQEVVEMAFETGTIRRVSKSDAKALQKALDAIVESGNKAFAFVADNADAIVETFRWPSVKRMTESEKQQAAINTLTMHSEGNEELAKWVVANREAVLAAYEAGVEKRQVNPKAAEALAAYRAAKAAEKAASAEKAD